MSGKKTLILIESPNKKHCFEHALGTDNYVIMASVGNVYDLPVDSFAIDIDNDFTADYIVMKDKIDVVKKIKDEYKRCKDVIFATDDDVEGEGISWGLAEILGVKNPMRATYNNTNPTTIKNAIKNLTPLNMDKVGAQHCRRYLDRIIGYKISPILWKVMNSCGSLSAGRVQSVGCRLIIERHFDIKKFFESETQSYFKVTADFNKKYKALLYTSKKNNVENDDDAEEEDEESEKEDTKSSGKLQVAKITKEDDTRAILDSIYKSTFTVSDVIEKDSTRSPCAPFTTTTVCQEASRKLGMSTKRTMDAAQSLFANGYCTYHRTDSVILSDDALKSIKKCVIDNYTKEYHREMQYKDKGGNTQGAHECLRVTDPNVKTLEKKMKDDEIRLYNLIWRRTIASQMAPAKFKTHIAEISISKLKDYKFITEYEECIFDGFLKVYNPNKTVDDGDEEDSDEKVSPKQVLPKKDSKLTISDVIATQDYKKPPSYFDEPAFLGILDKLKIGRPATIKSIIDKIQTANYVKVEDVAGVEKKSKILKLNDDGKIKEESKKILLGKANRRFVPTDLGIVITKFLVDNFPEIMDYEFTKDMENKLDDIKKGKAKMLDVLNTFYSTFSPLLDKLTKNITVDKLSLKQMKEIGVHPDLGHKIYSMLGKFGPMIQMLDDKNKVVNTAPIRDPLTLDTVKISDAVELFKFPRELGKYNNKVVYLCKGKYGFYVEHDKSKISVALKNDDDEEDNDIDDFSLADAIVKIEEKKSKTLWSHKDKTNSYVILEGPYGKYVNIQPIAKTPKSKAKNCKFPDSEDLEALTFERLQEIIKNSYTSKRKTTQKKTDNTEKTEVTKEKKKTTQKKPETKEKKPKAKKGDAFKLLDIEEGEKKEKKPRASVKPSAKKAQA